MEFTDQNGKTWTPSEMVAALMIHTTLFMAKVVIFCLIFNKMRGGSL